MILGPEALEDSTQARTQVEEVRNKCIVAVLHFSGTLYLCFLLLISERKEEFLYRLSVYIYIVRQTSVQYLTPLPPLATDDDDHDHHPHRDPMCTEPLLLFVPAVSIRRN